MRGELIHHSTTLNHYYFCANASVLAVPPPCLNSEVKLGNLATVSRIRPSGPKPVVVSHLIDGVLVRRAAGKEGSARDRQTGIRGAWCVTVME